MKSAALLMVVLLATSYAATAKPYHGHHHGPRAIHHANTSSDRESHSGITCEMVRACGAGRIGPSRCNGSIRWHHVIREGASEAMSR